MEPLSNLKERTKASALQIIKLTEKIPENLTGQIISKQIVRSGTSVGANYRAACRAKSNADFINKLKMVEEECDETMYWLEILNDSQLMHKTLLDPIQKEANELLAICVASIKTVKHRLLQ